MKVLAIGDINVDVILPSGPPPRGKQVVIGDFEIHGGGCATNFALACAKLGAEVKLIGRVGDDYWGQLVLKKLRENRINVEDVVVVKGGKTGATFALVEGAERSFITYRGENAVFSVKDVRVARIDADLVHIPSFFLLEKLQPDYANLMGKIRRKGIWVSFDTGWDPFGRWSDNKFLFAALKEADIFLPNLDEARIILRSLKADGRALVKKLFELGLRVTAIKMGERGSLVADRVKVARVPPFEVEVVDTTGAGDVFNAAFLLAYFSKKDVVLAGRFANAAAAISVTRAGWGNYPTRSEVNALLRSSGFEPLGT